MLEEAHRFVPRVQMQRTRAHELDAFLGNLGELTWAAIRYGDFRAHSLGENFGGADDASLGVEVKLSLRQPSPNYHLKVRADYGRHRRRAAYYVQGFLLRQGTHRCPRPDDVVCYTGFLPGSELSERGKIVEESYRGRALGFRTISVPLAALRSMDTFPAKSRVA